MSQDTMQGGSRDPLKLLRYSWTIRADGELEALYEAIERVTNMPRRLIGELLKVEPVGAGTYRIINRKEGTSVMARVTLKPPHTVFWPGPPTGMEFIVTFYPYTYKRIQRR